MTTIQEYAPYLIAGAFLIGGWLGILLMCMLAISRDGEPGCSGDCQQGRRPCDCVPKIGYPTKEES